MISPQEFARLWELGCNMDCELMTWTAKSLEDIRLPTVSKQFLIDAGLPANTAPFIGFDGSKNDCVANVAGERTLSDEYRAYWEIGFTGSGDPICIHEPSGRIVYINHDFNFEIVFMNSSVPQLAECLLSYQSFVRRVNQQNGHRAWLNDDIPSELLVWLTTQFSQIDPNALDEECFWWNEIYNH